MYATMAKRKKKMGRPKVDQPRVQITGFRGTPAFGEWFRALVEHQRMPAATVIEHALILYAEHVGFGKKPPVR